MRIALLAGGTGGAKLAAGMQEEIGSDLSVIANTGDDVEAFGVHVSPDPTSSPTGSAAKSTRSAAGPAR